MTITDPKTLEVVAALRELAWTAKASGRPVTVSGSTCTEIANELERVWRLINTPHTAEFLEAVKLEAAHQRERWAAEHDAGKTDADWFWLVGYLTGKALHSSKRAEQERESDAQPEPQAAAAKHNAKAVHHIITTAAALLNWHAAKTGADTRMRPGHQEGIGR